MGDAVLLEMRDGVAVLTLNRPDAQNTVSLQFAMDLDEATQRIATSQRSGDADGARAVLLTANGNSFCAGGDLKEFGGKDDIAAHIKEVLSYLHPAIERLDALDVPVVAAVRGSAAGAGLGLACAADIVLASPDAKFVSAYTRIGLSPDGSTSYSLPRLVGMRRALELVLTNRILDATEALEWGIVTRIVDDDQLDAEAGGVAKQLADGATTGLSGARRLVRDSLGRTLSHQLDMEAEAIFRSASDPNAKEGISAFLEKRSPSYRHDATDGPPTA
jgi:2-(1,2-epoxy-1,2-dihydrophenyl)acetyl-CoA isomerase